MRQVGGWHRGGGFTLIELLITLAILGVLATLVTPVVRIELQRQKENELRQSLRDIRRAIDAYKTAAEDGRIERLEGSSGYPKTLGVLVSGVKDVKNPNGPKIFFLRRMPLDPMVVGSLSPEERAGGSFGWGLRSYASDPDTPAPGNDVFDVYSTAKGVGLNAVPYGQW
jgi:general secretion pathway protein G